MEAQELTIAIAPDGQVRLAVAGVAGPACLPLTAELEKALGQVLERTPTARYYEATALQSQDARLFET